MNKKNHISLILNEFTTKFETVPENDSWKMYGFYLNLKTIVGRLIEVDGKRQSKIKNKEFLRMYNSVMKSAFNV